MTCKEGNMPCCPALTPSTGADWLRRSFTTFPTYAELLKNKEIEYGEKINVVVPTGNFGNILAAYYAKLMGIPVNKLICASNSNNVLTDFINTGVYDRNRKFYHNCFPVYGYPDLLQPGASAVSRFPATDDA